MPSPTLEIVNGSYAGSVEGSSPPVPPGYAALSASDR